MANDLISRKALIDDLRSAKGLGAIIAETIVRFLKKQPTVDAVEVVRCKDCKHYHFGVCLKIYSDGAVSQYAWQARNEDDFCSYGVKKGNSNISRKCDGVKVFCDGNCDNCLPKESWDRLKEAFDKIYDDESEE